MRDALWLVCLIAAATISVLFALHWRRTHDRFFAFFAAAFAALAATNALQLILDSGERTSAVYLLRLLGFGLIIGAIVDKNRPTASVQVPEDDWALPVHAGVERR